MNARNEENNDHFLQLPNQNHFQENCLENKLNKEGHTIEVQAKQHTFSIFDTLNIDTVEVTMIPRLDFLLVNIGMRTLNTFSFLMLYSIGCALEKRIFPKKALKHEITSISLLYVYRVVRNRILLSFV